MLRRALLVGIDDYDNVNRLSGCVADSRAMADLLGRNEDGSLNYDCQVFTAPGSAQKVTRAFVRGKWEELFADFNGDTLLYFSGHGAPTSIGGFLVTQEGTPSDPGLAMNELLVLANRSRARSVLLILDCCFSGSLGNPPNLQGDGSLENLAQLREGVTVLAASRPSQAAMEVGGHGVFTKLVLGALKGGAQDIRGRVSAASIYAYAESALGPWDQRPLYKSHASCLDPVRICTPHISDDLIRELPQLFVNPETPHVMAPSYEYTHESALPEHVEIFNKFKALRNAGVARTAAGDDLYYCALSSGTVVLTFLGRFLWDLASKGRI